MKTLARLCMLVFILISGCSPVRQVLKNPRYFQEVADSVVKRGYCINDTVLVLDTIVEEQVVDEPGYIQYTLRVAGLASVLHFDTMLSNGTKVTIHQGQLSVACPQVQQKTVYIKKEAVVRDRRLEDILNKEIKFWSAHSDSLQQVIKKRDLQIEEVELRLTIATAKFYTLLALLLGVIGVKLLRTFKII